ncbi:flavin monoamine oxidase family protein [Streptomyces sp. NPDC053560]|uniref:flavin monoamine oxidase family protein n=1 Tax=Streptomyces sp. NPDC053560 TaxID=3365711 RepID=UPI0037D8C674
MVDRYVQELCRELQPDIAAPEWQVTGRLAPYDRRSVHQVLRERGASEAAIELMEPFFLEMRGGDLKAASALAWLRHEASPHSLVRADPRWSKIKGGTDSFPRAFAERLKDHIHYRKPVVRVEQDADRARVTFVDHGGPQTIEADRVVVTVPFSAIRHIDFADAGFSEAKHEAMRRLKYSSIVRIYLQMRAKFWKEPNASYATDLPLRWVRDATPHLPGPRKIVECLITGWRARAVAAMTDEERLRFALDQLEGPMPGAREHFEAGTSVVWDQQPHIEGASLPPGPTTPTSCRPCASPRGACTSRAGTPRSTPTAARRPSPWNPPSAPSSSSPAPATSERRAPRTGRPGTVVPPSSGPGGPLTSLDAAAPYPPGGTG